MTHHSVLRYSAITQALHWATAIIVLIAFIYGPGGSEERIYSAARDFDRQLHETLGICVFALAVLRVLPLPVGVAVIGYALVFDRRALRVDYFLLCSFLFFFGLADNIKLLVESRMNHTGHIFLLSALASQAISNVPATLLFAKFTTDWQALLWGASVGGFGSLFGSLANLIAYKLYARHESSRRVGAFTLRFLVLGYLAFFVAIGLYFVLDGLAFL